MKKLFAPYSTFGIENKKDGLIEMIRLFDRVEQNYNMELLIDSFHANVYPQLYNKLRVNTSEEKIHKAMDLCEPLYLPVSLSCDPLTKVISKKDVYDSVKKYLHFIEIHKLSFKPQSEIFDDLTNAHWKKNTKKIQKLRKNFNELSKTIKITLKKQENKHDFIYKFLFGKSIEDYENEENTSIYEYIIHHGLLSTPIKNNPYIMDNENNNLSINKKPNRYTPEGMQIFLNHFNLHLLKISEQSEDFRNLSMYLIERVTNINLINCIFKNFEEFYETYHSNSLFNEIQKLSMVLGVYPLVHLRLKILNSLYEILKNNSKLDLSVGNVNDLIKMILHQTFVYLPILQIVMSLLRVTDEYICKLNEISNDTDVLFYEEEPPSKSSRKGFILKPLYDFPIFSNAIKNQTNNAYTQLDKKLYIHFSEQILKIYFESLTLPNGFNIRIAWDGYWNTRNANFFQSIQNGLPYQNRVDNQDIYKYIIANLENNGELVNIVYSLDHFLSQVY